MRLLILAPTILLICCSGGANDRKDEYAIDSPEYKIGYAALEATKSPLLRYKGKGRIAAYPLRGKYYNCIRFGIVGDQNYLDDNPGQIFCYRKTGEGGVLQI